MAKLEVKKTGNGGDKGERALVAQEPSLFHPVENLRREVDRLFEDFFGGGFLAPFPRRLFDWDVEPFRGVSRRIAALTPRIDVRESEKAYTIEAELPGMDEKDIELTLSGDMLTLEGEKKEEKEEKKEEYYLSERRYGSFKRTFRIPETVDRDKVAANFKKGVLTVSMPKTAKAKKEAKKIHVKAA